MAYIQSHPPTRYIAVGFSIAAIFGATSVYAANECQVEYSYHTGGLFDRKDFKKTIDLNSGETKTTDQGAMNYVYNKKAHKIKIHLSGAAINDLTMSNDQRDPIFPLNYATDTHTLKTIKCLNQTSNGQFFDSAADLIGLLKATNASINDIAKELKNTLNLSAQQVAQFLKDAGYPIEQVTGALKNALGVAATEAASILKTVFGATVDTIAPLLKTAGYAVNQVAAALKQTFNATAEKTATLLKTVFAASDRIVAVALKEAGYTTQQAASALLKVFNVSADAVEQVLIAAGFPVAEINAALAEFRTKLATAKNVNDLLSPTNLVAPPQACFGAIGNQCGLAPFDGMPPSALCSNGTCTINAGSWDHDECCFAHPRGMACRLAHADAVAGHDGNCQDSWNKAHERLARGLSWPRSGINFNTKNNTGKVEFDDYCAKKGSFVDKDDDKYCCNAKGTGKGSVSMPKAGDAKINLFNVRVCN
jgi:hypothetical protein